MYSKTYSQYLQKNNYIELKTLEYYLGGNQEKANNIFFLRHKLTSRGFELYTKYWLKNLGYKMKNFIGGNKADGGIDLKGEINNQKIYVQCKKYIKNYNHKGKVGVSDIRNFYGGVVSEYNGNIKESNLILLFITTGSYTHQAKNFAKKNNIDLVDYKDLSDITILYNLDKFLDDFSKTGNIKNIKNIDFEQMDLINYTFDELLPKDVYEFLKNIREHIVDDILKIEEKNTGFETFENNTLYKIAKDRINNYKGLKKLHKNCSNELEKEHIVNFSNELIKGFKILENKKD